MDIDPPNNCSNLKRSNSAPMINELTNSPTSSQSSFQPRPNQLGTPRLPRVAPTRRFSGSFSPASPNSTAAPLSPLLSRVEILKHEEMDVVFREAAHERETKSKLQMSHSLEDLTLEEPLFGESAKRQALTDPLRIFTSHVGACSSPSPTNTGRQCFSPSTCLPVPHSAFSSTPSPSPTRKNSTLTRCSQSPISLRPSQLCQKRKYEMDSDDGDYRPTSAKMQNTGLNMPSAHQIHLQNLSYSSMDACSSDMSNDEHPSSPINNSMPNSPYGTFKPLDPAPSEQNL